MNFDCFLPDELAEALQRLATMRGLELPELAGLILEEYTEDFEELELHGDDEYLVEVISARYPVAESNTPVGGEEVFSENLLRSISLASTFCKKTGMWSLPLLCAILSLPYSGAAAEVRTRGVDPGVLAQEIFELLQTKKCEGYPKDSDFGMVYNKAMELKGAEDRELTTRDILRAMMSETQCDSHSLLSTRGLGEE